MAQPPPTPSLVSLNSFQTMASPSPRRLWSSFARPSQPVSRRKLAWVSLEGRLVNAEEASSAGAVKGWLSREEDVAWELFTPIQRFLIVAVKGVAAAESKKNRLISQLQKSVEFTDQVLLSMQQKLDSLCEQLYYVKDHQGVIANMSSNGKAELAQNETFGSDKTNFVECGCWLCYQHHNYLTGLTGNCCVKNFSKDEMMQYKMTHAVEAEQEERRMSDLSDWASSSGISSIEIQVVQLTRQHRSSSSVSTSVLDSNYWQLPVLSNDLIYNMDSTTSPSSSDTDSPLKNRPVAIKHQ